MQNKQKHTLIITIILVLTFSLILLIRTRANQDGITISPKVHFGLPPYATYINFSTRQTLRNLTLNNASWFWYFEDYGFQIQNANATITNFFIDNQLTLNLYAPTGNTSTTKIYVADLGEPTTVTGADSWNYNPSTKIVTLTKTHTSPATIEINWAVTYPGVETIAGLIPLVMIIGSILAIFTSIVAIYTTRPNLEKMMMEIIATVLVVIILLALIPVIANLI